MKGTLDLLTLNFEIATNLRDERQTKFNDQNNCQKTSHLTCRI